MFGRADPERSPLRARVSPRALLLAAWFAVVALGVLGVQAGGHGAALPGALLVAALWTATLGAAFALTPRWPIYGPRGPRHLALHLVVGSSFWVAHGLLGAALGHAVEVRPLDLLVVVLAYLLFVGVAHLVEYRRRYREKELTETRLQAVLAEAELQRTRIELQALKAELNPHFLFNSLHAVSALMHEDVRLANRMLVRVSELLRSALASVGTERVPLEEELDFVRLYLEVEEIRFRGKLAVEWEIDDGALDAAVPHLILQPLVENAIKHGIAPRGEGRIRLRAAREGERLRLEVRDDGVGIRAGGSGAPGTGVGLQNSRHRLSQLYGEEHSIALRPASEGGTVAELVLPWREEVEAYPAPPLAPLPAVPVLRMRAGAPPEPEPAPARPLPWLLAGVRPGVLGRAAAWSLLWAVSLLSLSETQVLGRSVPLWAAGLAAALNATVLMALFAVSYGTTRRAPLWGRERLPHLLVHLRAAGALAVASVAAKALGRLLMRFPRAEILPESLVAMLAGYLLFYALLASVAHAMEFVRRIGEKEIAELRLRREVTQAELQRAQAELQILKIELDPHFLFSSLHAISSLIHTDARRANRILVRLSELLRGALRSRSRRLVPLEEEVQALEPLVEIESARLDDRLRVSWELEEEALDARVPPLILVSLLEHVLQHGVTRGAETREIRVTARRRDARLELELEDGSVEGLNGASAPPAAARSLAGIRTRLQQLYGDAHRLRIRSGAAAGPLVRLELPWTEEEGEEPALVGAPRVANPGEDR